MTIDDDDGPVGNWRNLEAFTRVQAFSLDLLCRYFRVDVQGLDRIPRQGPAILIANHSGFAGFDALVLSHVIHSEFKREPRILAHHGYFDWWNWVRTISYRLLLREAHVSTAVKTLEHGHLLIVFPEGVAGNFKSSLHRYELQKFHTGFVRLALESGAPIIPVVITGAEESNFSLGNINLGRWYPHVRIPLPINLVPLPAKWAIRILEPIPLGEGESIFQSAKSIQAKIQGVLAGEVEKREFIYWRRS